MRLGDGVYSDANIPPHKQKKKSPDIPPGDFIPYNLRVSNRDRTGDLQSHNLAL